MRSALSVLSGQRRSWPLPLPAGQLIPRHTVAVVVFDTLTPRLGFPPKVAGFVLPWTSLFFSGAGRKWYMAAPREAGLPGERPDAVTSQQPTAAQRTLTPGVLAAEPQLPR